MNKAKDFMTQNPHTVQSGSRIVDELVFFADSGITTAPVVTPMGETIGILTEVTLMKAYLKSQVAGNMEKAKVIDFQKYLDQAVFVFEDTDIGSVIKKIIKAPNHRVIVNNKMNNITGIISPKDILRHISGSNERRKILQEELKETREQLQKANEQLKDTKAVLKNYQGIYEESPTMMHSVNKDGEIIMANKKIHQVLGYDPGELLKEKTLFDLYAKSCHHNAMEGLKKIIHDGSHHTTYSTMMTKDGAKIRVDISSSSLYDKYGKFIGTISVSRQVDSDSLLRALHGALDKPDLKEEDIEELLSGDSSKGDS